MGIDEILPLLAADAASAPTGAALAASAAAAPTGAAIAGGTALGATSGGLGALGTAALTAGASGVAGSAASALLSRRGGINIPPPPGAAMIDPAGATAAAQIRARQAAAGGLASTNIPGANNASAYSTATSGSKGTLGG